MKVPKIIENIKIDFQRWNYRRMYKAGEKVDIEKQLKAVEKADKLSKKRKCKLWVVRLMPGRYKIYSKGDVKSVLRKMGLKGRIDIFQNSDVVVHITR
jgi:hypothetical protein